MLRSQRVACRGRHPAGRLRRAAGGHAEPGARCSIVSAAGQQRHPARAGRHAPGRRAGADEDRPARPGHTSPILYRPPGGHGDAGAGFSG